MSVLFLDIDGVLNDHTFDPAAESNTIKPECVRAFNRVLHASRPTVIVSSAWRYMVFGEVMTWVGFGYMLRTHGVDRLISGLIGGTIRADTMTDGGAKPNERGQQIAEWVAEHEENQRKRFPGRPPLRYAVVDDLDLGITAAGHPFVQTDGKVGLTEADADRLIELLDPAEDAP